VLPPPRLVPSTPRCDPLFYCKFIGFFLDSNLYIFSYAPKFHIILYIHSSLFLSHNAVESRHVLCVLVFQKSTTNVVVSQCFTIVYFASVNLPYLCIFPILVFFYIMIQKVLCKAISKKVKATVSTKRVYYIYIVYYILGT
jgi:hypothetical protein